MNNATLVKKKNAVRELLLKMDDAEINQLAEVLPLESVTVVSPPKTGLMMAKVRDCFESDFYLGEVLVTRAEVDYCGHRAQATVIGDKLKTALIAAVLEAVCLSGEAEIFEAAALASQLARKRVAAADDMTKKLIAATQVNFQTMAKDS